MLVQSSQNILNYNYILVVGTILSISSFLIQISGLFTDYDLSDQYQTSAIEFKKLFSTEPSVPAFQDNPWSAK